MRNAECLMRNESFPALAPQPNYALRIMNYEFGHALRTDQIPPTSSLLPPTSYQWLPTAH